MNPAIFDRPSGAGALLGPGDIATPTAGYSLRYLSINYFGQPVIRVRKDVVGNPEQDFTPNQLTDGTLATFLGANDGFVSKWYDQFGSNDAEQTSASSQPKIWDASTGLVTENGKPSILYSGSKWLNASPEDYSNGLVFVTAIASINALSQGGYIFAQYTTAGNERSWYVGYDNNAETFRTNLSEDGATFAYIEFEQPSFGELFAYTTQIDVSLTGTDKVKSFLNSLQMTVSDSSSISTIDALYNTTANIGIGARGSTGEASLQNGKISEILFYTSDQTSNRTKIEDNINDYYDIY